MQLLYTYTYAIQSRQVKTRDIVKSQDRGVGSTSLMAGRREEMRGENIDIVITKP
jgi:hypothetical protein